MTAIGRARTVLVLGQGDAARAAVSVVVARARRTAACGRLNLRGPAVFEEQAATHLRATVLAVVNQILDGLGLAKQSFDVSVVNLGAASAADLGLSISGFSADTAVALAMLSAALKMPLPQDVVTTGHIASPDGDIRPVRSIPAKLEAALQVPEIRAFVHPALDEDNSMQALSPAEKERIAEAVVNAKGRLRLAAVGHVTELLQATVMEEAVVLASLRRGFFEPAGRTAPRGCLIDDAVRFLSDGNDGRFWRVLEAHLLEGRCAEAQALLLTRCHCQVRRRRYPGGFGGRLLQLVRSLPPATRRLKTSFPLLAMGHCLEVCRFAGQADHEDVQRLLDAAQGRGMTRERPAAPAPASDSQASADANAAVDAVLSEISAQMLTETIGLPIDAARAAYVMDGVLVESLDAYHDTMAAFYLHLLRHTGAMPATSDNQAALAEALALVEGAFANKGGADAALAEARDGTRGGMRSVLDAMTERYEAEQQVKHVERVLKEALDPQDWSAREAFMAALLSRIGPQLPPEIRAEPPGRYARHYDSIVPAYVRSVDQVRQLFRTL